LRTTAAVLSLLLLAGLAAVSWAAPAGPTGPIELIAPAGAGGGWDTLCRMTARALTAERLVTQPITVTNMPGGSGAVAIAHMVTRRKGDGNVLAAFSPALTLTIVNRNTPYTYRDVVPVASLSTDYGVLVVRRDSAIRDLRTLAAVLRQNPGGVTVAGGSAPGSMDHIILAKWAKAAGVDPLKLRYLPFQGGGEALAAVLGGSASVLTTGASEVIGQLEAGQVRVLGIFAERRLGGPFAGVATAGEQGFSVTFPIWRGFYAPPDSPTVRFWEETLVRMSQSREWAKILDELKWFPFVLTGDRFRRFLEQDTANFEALLKDLGFVK